MASALALRKQMVAIYFDIEKACDTAGRYGILRQLHEDGLRGSLALSVENFLRNRSFSVRVGHAKSDRFTQGQGTPQGSVLSCTLFLVAINGIVRDLPVEVKATLYVDDLAIYMTSSHMPTAERKLQLAINRISKLAKDYGYRLAHGKTTGINYSKKRGGILPRNYISMGT